MNSIFDDAELPLTCPECGHTTKKRVAILKMNPRVTCGGCGKVIQVQADDLRHKLDGLQRQFERMGFKSR